MVYAVVVPYAGIALTLLFFDRRRRLVEKEPRPAPAGALATTSP